MTFLYTLICAEIPQITRELAWIFVVFPDPYKAEVQFGQLPPPRHLEYDVTSMSDDLGAAARDWVSERTDYLRYVAQLALAHEADGGVGVGF
jgi:hypothetical protein